MRSAPRCGVASSAAVAIAIVAWGASVSAPVARALSGDLPAPRVIALQPRVVALEARVLALRPRVISVAPAQPLPGTFAVNTDVLFAFDSSRLSSSARSVLVSVVRELSEAKPGAVSIVGYTDSIGTAAYNLGLSRRRAVSVEAYLEANVHNQRLAYHATGRGEADAVAPNKLPNGQDNPTGRQKNRRVVITYTRS